MKRSTLEERKRFAEQLAERDETLRREGAHASAKSSRVATARALPPERPSFVVEKPEVVLAPTDAELLARYRMRRWWLDRYTLDEIRELAECLQ